MNDSFRRLKEQLLRLCGSGPVYYVSNPGNWGDALIRAGTLKLLRDAGMEFREKKLRKRQWIIPRLRGGTVLYGGGGGWNAHWNLNRLVEPLARHFQVVVLPSTYAGCYSMERARFFRRDNRESRDFMPASEFCHDLAFYIGDEFRTSDMGRGCGWFFRTDCESVGWKGLPASNRDLSLEGNHTSEVSGFFEAVARYAVVHTDRLHVAIAGCLLGREVNLYANNYFKNRAVFESSMRGIFERVRFRQFDPSNPWVAQDRHVPSEVAP